MTKKKRIVVVCPGRGSYTQETLGYLKSIGAENSAFVAQMNKLKADLSEPTIAELDGAPKFDPKFHLPGENASVLIHTCAYSDYLQIDQDKFEIVAVIGNSMGWYIALAVAGVLDNVAAFQVINTMGSMMKDALVGAQAITSVVDDEWAYDPKKQAKLEQVMEEVNQQPDCSLYLSINLGGYRVVAGNDKGVSLFLKTMPKDGIYPFKLMFHGAFHTELLGNISRQGFERLGQNLFRKPGLPLIDGNGKIWQPYSSSVEGLRDYTLGHQVTRAYDFSASVRVALREFAPDHLVLLGPGGTLGGSIGQVMIESKWKGIHNKNEFSALQKDRPFLISMGMKEQRKWVSI